MYASTYAVLLISTLPQSGGPGAGAGGIGESVNGWFQQDGVLNAKPKYRQRDGTAIIYFSGPGPGR